MGVRAPETMHERGSILACDHGDLRDGTTNPAGPSEPVAGSRGCTTGAGGAPLLAQARGGPGSRGRSAATSPPSSSRVRRPSPRSRPSSRSRRAPRSCGRARAPSRARPCPRPPRPSRAASSPRPRRRGPSAPRRPGGPSGCAASAAAASFSRNGLPFIAFAAASVCSRAPIGFGLEELLRLLERRAAELEQRLLERGGPALEGRVRVLLEVVLQVLERGEARGATSFSAIAFSTASALLAVRAGRPDVVHPLRRSFRRCRSGSRSSNPASPRR